MHLVCALYTPGVAFGDVDKLSPVTLFEMPYSRWGARVRIKNSVARKMFLHIKTKHAHIMTEYHNCIVSLTMVEGKKNIQSCLFENTY